MREYLLLFLVAAITTYLLSVVARELAHRLGAVAQVRDRDVHVIPIPYFGGIAMLGGLGAAYLVARQLPFLSQSQPQVFHDAGAVLGAGTVICLVGVIDDIFELDALTKLGGQVLAAAVLVLGDVQLYSLRLPGLDQFVLDSSQAILFTGLLVVGTVNAINFVDGLDGLAAGMVGLGAIAFFVFSYQLAVVNGYTLAITAAVLCAGLAGACIGFLPHNFYPARIFMGDSGSMLIGLVLVGAALSLTGQFASLELDPTGTSSSAWAAMLLPILLPISIMVVPLVDLILAVVRRTRRGQMFYQPDKEHLHHRLLQIGHSHPGAVIIMWFWAALVAFGTVMLALYPQRELVHIAVAVAAVAVLALTWLLPRSSRIQARAQAAAAQQYPGVEAPTTTDSAGPASTPEPPPSRR